MKHLTKPIALLLALVLLLPLAPAARAAEDDGDDDNEISGIASVADITVKSARSDGHLNFGESSDVKTISPSASTVKEALAKVCADALSTATLEYVSYVAVDATQGTIYNGYTSEADTGAGVAGVSRYYYNDSTDAAKHISDIRFVPAASFSGNATITYFGYYNYTKTDGDGNSTAQKGSYSGKIIVQVGAQEPGISYSTDGEAVRFSSEDFSSYTLAVTGRNFRYITFTVPSSDKGTMYYNYLGNDIYDFEINSGRRFYPSQTPDVDKVYFLPAKDYEGSFQLHFTIRDLADKDISGELTMKVSANGPSHEQSLSGGLTYRVAAGRSVALKWDDLKQACKTETGNELSYVRFSSLPSYGTLYKDYYSGDNRGNRVSVNERFYSSDNVRYTAPSDYTGTVSVPFVGYAYGGDWFDGTLRFVVTDGSGSGTPLSYKVAPGERVYFVAGDFADACTNATGYDISRIEFTSIPSSYNGTLYDDDGDPITRSRNTYYYKSELNRLSFRASNSFDGVQYISFIGYASGYSSSNDRSFRGTVTITSTKYQEQAASTAPIGGSSTPLVYYSTGPAVTLRASDLQNAASASLPGTPETVTLTRPSENAGRLCLDFVSLSSYSAFASNKAWPIADAARVSFLPKAGFSGEERISFTVRDKKGNSYMGNIRFIVSPPTRSFYFSDMGECAWAVPAVDFFRYYGAAQGVSANGFGPAEEMRRADFVLLLSRAFAFPAAGYDSFQDVSWDAYYAPALASAKALGILTDDDVVDVPNPEYVAAAEAVEQALREREALLIANPRARLGAAPSVDPNIPQTMPGFDPEGVISRQDAALFLYRALRWRAAAQPGTAAQIEPGTAADLAAFPDNANTAPYAVEAMGALVRRGVFTGDAGRLRPAMPLSRAETITILYRALT